MDSCYTMIILKAFGKSKDDNKFRVCVISCLIATFDLFAGSLGCHPRRGLVDAAYEISGDWQMSILARWQLLSAAMTVDSAIRFLRPSWNLEQNGRTAKLSTVTKLSTSQFNQLSSAFIKGLSLCLHEDQKIGLARNSCNSSNTISGGPSGNSSRSSSKSNNNTVTVEEVLLYKKYCRSESFPAPKIFLNFHGPSSIAKKYFKGPSSIAKILWSYTQLMFPEAMFTGISINATMMQLQELHHWGWDFPKTHIISLQEFGKL